MELGLLASRMTRFGRRFHAFPDSIAGDTSHAGKASVPFQPLAARPRLDAVSSGLLARINRSALTCLQFHWRGSTNKDLCLKAESGDELGMPAVDNSDNVANCISPAWMQRLRMFLIALI